ncbi:hypothetical protein BJX66DRAFT_317874 [Aspergillus keveii]|uniref:Uncharacterized protein n=1 Tax=Aspergillus keveii TaxID=714993 RepID=A0ABR4FKQ6_9EURO
MQATVSARRGGSTTQEHPHNLRRNGQLSADAQPISSPPCPLFLGTQPSVATPSCGRAPARTLSHPVRTCPSRNNPLMSGLCSPMA